MQKAASRAGLADLGSYYQMSAFRVLRRCVAVRANKNLSPFQGCELEPELCDLLLRHNGGAKAGACKQKLESFETAEAVVLQMREELADYCLCDLAWLCLAKPGTKEGQ